MAKTQTKKTAKTKKKIEAVEEMIATVSENNIVEETPIVESEISNDVIESEVAISEFSNPLEIKEEEVKIEKIEVFNETKKVASATISENNEEPFMESVSVSQVMTARIPKKAKPKTPIAINFGDQWNGSYII